MHNKSLKGNTVMIIDFGSQFTQLIARRIREMHVFSTIIPFSNLTKDHLDNVGAIILSGSPTTTTYNEHSTLPNEIFSSGIPILGICYGQHLVAVQSSGKVQKSEQREFGRTVITVLSDSQILEGISLTYDNTFNAWMSHGDKVTEIPDTFKVVASSDGAPYAVFEDNDKLIYGIQFHPEVAHTDNGSKILENFVLKIAGISPEWTMKSYLSESVERIKHQVGSDHVVCGLSGGVDSAVTAIMVHKAIGSQLTCIFVDTGLLRKKESEQVVSLFKDQYNIPLIHINAADQFFKALQGVTDPEKKRKIIGNLFVEIFDTQANNIGSEVKFLAQGTLYPDVVESFSVRGGPSETIKSHHNVGGLPENMKLQLVEPLRELFKDEVRALARELEIDSRFTDRHPFPGPGLAIRIMGEVTPEKVNTLQEVDALFIQAICDEGLYNRIWQAFAVLLPVCTVGVMGDGRTYENVCALRAITSSDGMTADFFHFDMDFLAKISIQIVNNVKGVNRVVYDVTSKPPATIEWE